MTGHKAAIWLSGLSLLGVLGVLIPAHKTRASYHVDGIACSWNGCILMPPGSDTNPGRAFARIKPGSRWDVPISAGHHFRISEGIEWEQAPGEKRIIGLPTGPVELDIPHESFAQVDEFNLPIGAHMEGYPPGEVNCYWVVRNHGAIKSDAAYGVR